MTLKRNRGRGHKRLSTKPRETLEPLVALWILRILFNRVGLQAALNAETSLQIQAYLAKPRLRAFFDLEDAWPSAGPDNFEPDDKATKRRQQRALNLLYARFMAMEAAGELPEPPPVLAANIGQLARLVNLDDTETRILSFTVLLNVTEELGDLSELLGGMRLHGLYETLGEILDLAPGDAARALAMQGALAMSGLLRVNPAYNYDLVSKLALLSDSFAGRMVAEECAPLELLRDTVIPSRAPGLSRADFQHVERDLEILLHHLRRCLTRGCKGVNILFHGAPGTGKTELARLVAKLLAVELYEISSENDEGNAIDGASRLRVLRAAQILIARRQALLVFDEAEDVFGRGFGADMFALFLGKDGEAQRHKAWINKALESNTTPTLWITNTIGGIDPAFMRRFDMVLELPIPPKRQRERIVAESAADLLPQESIRRLACSEHLSPAVVARAIDVIRNIREDLPESAIPGAVERLVNGTLRAQGHATLEGTPARPPGYDPALANADIDLEQLGAGLCRAGQGRLCLYGPPGTGKTAFGQWLADRLGRPLMTKRASDLIEMWVGASERNIAQAFRAAADENALLLLDEVDSFLRDRRGARGSWEVTLVNEMLTQMESFSGVFIAATNLVDDLDQAALRRFDLKLKFNFLRAAQAWRLMQDHCRTLGLGEPDGALRERLGRLDNLTPGDFAAVARRHRFSPLASVAELHAALVEECARKEGGKAHVLGFIG